jgi:hypothetical protein
MNERIKLLALQAGLRFTQLMSNPMVPVVDGKETDLEKFAELIVLECAEICNQSILHNEDMLPKFNKPSELYEKLVTHGAILQAEKLIDGIKEHFGVEE